MAAAALTTLAAVVGCLILLAGLGGDPASASGARPAFNAEPSGVTTRYVAEPGDTLWSIASRFRGDIDHDRYLAALVDANGGPAIQAGQVVELP